MTTRPSAWCIDRCVAEDLAAVIGWAPGDGVPALVAAMGARLPAGSTAKLAAVASGEAPPGADPEQVARAIIDAAGRGTATPSWSCWVSATVMAAMVATHDLAAVQVAATRRVDPNAPAVDFHSAVLTDDGHRSWLCDPFFLGVLPGPGCDEVEAVGNGVWGCRHDDADGRWSFRLANGRYPQPLHYRQFATPLGRDDVWALCTVSVAFTGVPNRPGARVWTADAITDLLEREDGVVGLREWRWDRPGGVWDGRLERTTFDSWPQGCEAFADRTGVLVR